MTFEEFEELMEDFRQRYRAATHLGLPPLSKERIEAMYPEHSDGDVRS